MVKATSKEEVVQLIIQKKIIHFEDIFTIGKYSEAQIYAELGIPKSRLTLYKGHPENIRIRDLRIIAYHFNVHYLVILRLIDRQLEDNNYRLKKFFPPPLP